MTTTLMALLLSSMMFSINIASIQNSTTTRQGQLDRLAEIEYELALIRIETCKLMEERAKIRIEIFSINDPQYDQAKFRQIRYDDGAYAQRHPIKIEATEPPTLQPTQSPSSNPTQFPTIKPTKCPTLRPTAKPTLSPTIKWDHVRNHHLQKQQNDKSHVKLNEYESSNVSALSSTSNIELYQLTLWNGQKDPFLPKDHFECNEFLKDRINTKMYDLIITKYQNKLTLNASNVRSYTDDIDILYEEVHANYIILLAEGPNVSNLARFRALIDEFSSFYKGDCLQFLKSGEVTNAIMRAKLKSEFSAKILAIEICERLFWCIHELKIAKIKHLINADVWSKIKGRIQNVFDSAKMHMINLQTNTTLTTSQISRSYFPYYELLVDEVAGINTIKYAHDPVRIFEQWMTQHQGEGESFKVCIISSSINEIGMRISNLLRNQEHLMMSSFRVLFGNWRRKKQKGQRGASIRTVQS